MTDVIKYVLPVLLLPAAAIAGGSGNVLPLQSHAYGTTYGELAQDWLPWALAGTDTNPLVDETGAHCAEGQSGKVWFLAGTTGGDVERECTMSVGKAIYFPVLNAFWVQWPEDDELTDEEIHDLLDYYYLSNVVDLWVIIDGDEVEDVWDYRVEGDAYEMTLGEDRVWPSVDDAGPGPYDPTIVDGWFMLLTPLSKGSHVIEFGGLYADGSGISATYDLTVE